jgi:hypothetical protein
LYAWIWRHLPFGLPGKIAGSVLLVSLAVAALWFWGFPAAEPLLPFGDVQVEDGGGPGAPDVPGAPTADPSESEPPPDVIPYSTVENQPSR